VEGKLECDALQLLCRVTGKCKHMYRDKQKQEISLIGRLFSLEALLVIMGFLSLISGILSRELLRFSLGVIILGGVLLAVVLRRKRRIFSIGEKQHRRKDD
jgi:hypothetical protein